LGQCGWDFGLPRGVGDVELEEMKIFSRIKSAARMLLKGEPKKKSCNAILAHDPIRRIILKIRS
jgi:hypothetical protein